MARAPFHVSFFNNKASVRDFFGRRNKTILSAAFSGCYCIGIHRLPHFFSCSARLSCSGARQIASVGSVRRPTVQGTVGVLSVRRVHLACRTSLPTHSNLNASDSFTINVLGTFCTLGKGCTSGGGLTSRTVCLRQGLYRRTNN